MQGAALLAWISMSAVSGPLAAGDRVYRGVLAGITDLLGMSMRRVWALARLAIQESLRRNVLIVLGLFARSDQNDQTYFSFLPIPFHRPECR